MKTVSNVAYLLLGMIMINIGFVSLYPNAFGPNMLERSTLDYTMYLLMAVNVLFIYLMKLKVQKDLSQLNLFMTIGCIPLLMGLNLIVRYIFILLRF